MAEPELSEPTVGSAPDPESILKAWDDYTASIEKSKPTAFSQPPNHKPRINDEGVLELLLNTETQRDHFVKNVKGELTAYIRKSTGSTAIDIVAGVEKSQRDAKKLYTDQDRLNYLIKKNPGLGDLKTRFGLDFDN